MPHENPLQWGSVFVKEASENILSRKHPPWMSTSNGAASCQLLTAINNQQAHYDVAQQRVGDVTGDFDVVMLKNADMIMCSLSLAIPARYRRQPGLVLCHVAAR